MPALRRRQRTAGGRRAIGERVDNFADEGQGAPQRIVACRQKRLGCHAPQRFLDLGILRPQGDEMQPLGLRIGAGGGEKEEPRGLAQQGREPVIDRLKHHRSRDGCFARPDIGARMQMCCHDLSAPSAPGGGCTSRG